MKLAANLERLGTESAFSVLAEAKKLEAQGNPMIHLGLGQPDFKTPPHVVEAAKKALDDGHHGYVMSNGIPECRQAVTRWIKKRYDADVDFERILIMPGGKPTMSYAIQCFGEPGAEIIHPTPAFPIYESMINYTGSTSVPYDLTEDKDLKFSADKILSLITDKTRLLILINPNNPTGSFVEKPEIDKLAEGLKKHPHVTILSDEIYSRQIFDGKEMPTFFNYPELRDRLIVLEGWSKAYSMTGWRLGWSFWPETLVPHVNKLLINSVSCVNAAAQFAGIAALDGPDDSIHLMMEKFTQRRKLIHEGLNSLPGVECSLPGGAFYAFPKVIGTGMNGAEFCKKAMHEAGVAIVPGTAFGKTCNDYVRFSFAASQDNISNALENIKKNARLGLMTELALPKIDKKTLDKKDYIFKSLAKLINPEYVLSHKDEIKPYETDGLSAYKQTPLAVVMPENTKEVSSILKFCHEENIKVVPRGAGTGLSGGALPLQDAVLLSLGKFNKILEIDFENKCVVTQPGVTNLGLTHAVQHKGFYYAPDPSSQLACSIGGNVAENSGGVHSLKYGTTTNNILGVEMVMMDGTICRIGGKTLDQEGYDLMGLICGSEGLLGVITEVTAKILKKPQVVKAALIGFPTIEEGANATSEIISNGIIPAGMEIMDKALIEATDNFSKAGYPRDAELLLIVEVDGTESEVDVLLKDVSSICKKNNCSSLKLSQSEKERLSFWSGRKSAFPACGAMAPDYYCMDGVIPRGKLAEALLEIKRLSEKYNLPVANCFHAGDGNLHPLIMYNGADKEQFRKTEEFGAEILKACVRLGGVITGEHGVGVEKRELMCEMFNDTDIQQQLDIKTSLDEKNLLNPGKVYPILRKCAEEGRVHVHRGEEKFPDLPRF